MVSEWQSHSVLEEGGNVGDRNSQKQLHPPNPFKSIFENFILSRSLQFLIKKAIEEVQISSDSYTSAVEVDKQIPGPLPSGLIN